LTGSSPLPLLTFLIRTDLARRYEPISVEPGIVLFKHRDEVRDDVMADLNQFIQFILAEFVLRQHKRLDTRRYRLIVATLKDW
jgi:hypothetical protein